MNQQEVSENYEVREEYDNEYDKVNKEEDYKTTNKQLYIPLENENPQEFHPQNELGNKVFENNPKLQELYKILSNPSYETYENQTNNLNFDYQPFNSNDNLTNRLKKYLQGNKSRLSKTPLSDKVKEFKNDLESLKERINEINHKRVVNFDSTRQTDSLYPIKNGEKQAYIKSDCLTMKDYFNKYVIKSKTYTDAKATNDQIKIQKLEPYFNTLFKSKFTPQSTQKQTKSKLAFNYREDQETKKENFLTKIHTSIISNKKKFEEKNSRFLEI